MSMIYDCIRLITSTKQTVPPTNSTVRITLGRRELAKEVFWSVMPNSGSPRSRCYRDALN